MDADTIANANANANANTNANANKHANANTNAGGSTTALRERCSGELNMNPKSLEHEDVLYFDLQPHPMTCTLGSEVMEWKQTLQGFYIWKINAFWWLTDVI